MIKYHTGIKRNGVTDKEAVFVQEAARVISLSKKSRATCKPQVSSSIALKKISSYTKIKYNEKNTLRNNVMYLTNRKISSDLNPYINDKIHHCSFSCIQLPIYVYYIRRCILEQWFSFYSLQIPRDAQFAKGKKN